MIKISNDKPLVNSDNHLSNFCPWYGIQAASCIGWDNWIIELVGHDSTKSIVDETTFDNNVDIRACRMIEYTNANDFKFVLFRNDDGSGTPNFYRYLKCYNSEMTLQWTATLETPVATYNTFVCNYVTSDSFGNTYISGYWITSGYTRATCYKISNTGSVTRYYIDANTFFYACDYYDGDIYLIGFEYPNYGVYINGTLYGSSISGLSEDSKITVSAYGYIYYSKISTDGSSETLYLFGDSFSKRFTTETYEVIRSLTTDEYGNIYCAVYTGSPATTFYGIVKIDTLGAVQWTQTGANVKAVEATGDQRIANINDFSDYPRGPLQWLDISDGSYLQGGFSYCGGDHFCKIGPWPLLDKSLS